MPGCEAKKEIYTIFRGDLIVFVISCKDSEGHEGMHQGDLPVLGEHDPQDPVKRKTKLETFWWEDHETNKN